MGWLIPLLLTLSVALMLGQNLASEQDIKSREEFEAELQVEALKVLKQHMDEMSQVPQISSYAAPQRFMRSFIPGTGVGNREELVIDSIKQIPAFQEETYTQWRYKRFNNTDYILGLNERKVILNKLDSTNLEYFTFANDNVIFNFIADPWSTVKDVTIFTRVIKRSAALYVAILTEAPRASLVNIYEIIGERGIPVGLIDLGISPSSAPNEAKKIAFVESEFGSSLVVLIDTLEEARIISQQKGSSELNHYLEVHYPSAVDLVTFTVHGNGYLAVASDTSCEIFKLDKNAQNSRQFDRIAPRVDLVDLEYFRLGFHHYLAVSGRNEQYLYIWKSGEFALKQVLHEQNVGQLYSATLPTCRDDVIVFVIRDVSVGIYVYDGKIDNFVLSDADIPSTFLVSPGSITSFTNKNKVELVFKGYDNLVAFIIETSLKPTENPFLVAGENVSNYMKKLQQILEEQAKQLQDIKNILSNAVRTTGDQYITAYQKFDNLHANEGAVVKNIEEIIYVEWDNTDLTLEQYKIGTADLEKKVTDLEKLVEDMEKIIPDVVRIDEDAEITGAKTFLGDVSGLSILADSVYLQNVAGINVPQLQKEIYRLDKPQRISGTLIFEQPLTIKGHLEIEGTVNGIDISRDVMTTNTEQTSYANMIFKNKVVVQGDLSISGKLNDIDVSTEVVTLSGTHNITGRKSFQNGIIAGNVETSLLDGVDINELYGKALTKSGDQIIYGTKTFSGGLVTNNIILDGLLNELNIVDLANNIVRVDRPAHITGTKTFVEDVHVHGALSVKGTVNGLKIPDDLFLTDEFQTVTGEKKFTGVVTAHNVVVEGTVDDLDIPRDVVTLSGDEEVSSTLYFTEGINVDNDIIVHGLVDGVDIAEVAKQALKINETRTFKDAIFYGPVAIADSLKVGGTVNGIDLDAIVKDIIFKGDKVAVESEKHFKKVVADTVHLEHMINGYNISADFMKANGEQNITGTKVFRQPVIFKSLTTSDGMLGKFNVTKFMEHRIYLQIEDDPVDVEFSDDVIVEAIRNHVTVDNLIVRNNADISGTFGGIDLVEFYNNRVTLSGEDVIEGDVWLGNTTIQTVELSGLVNEIDIEKFASNVMSKTKPQEILAEKIFTGEVIVHGPITTKEGINGVNLADMNNRAFKLRGDNYVTKALEFEDVTVQNIHVAGLINGLNLTYIAEDSLKKTGPQVVTGKTTFEAGFQVDGDIDADTVNDLNIPRDILLKSIPQAITGKFTIQTLNVAGDVVIDGLVNGLDLSEIAQNIAQTGQDTVIDSNVTFAEPIHVYEDVNVTGVVNGIDLNRISETILLKEGDQIITGSKVLKGNVTIRGNFEVDYVNDHHWKRFLDDIVRIDIPQVIRAPKTFTMDTEINTVVAEKANAALINGRSLEEFLNDAVFIDVPAHITGHKEFRRDVKIEGNLNAELINGLNLEKDVITLACIFNPCPQIITGEKTFDKLTIHGNVHVPGTVNTYNLFDLYQDTLLQEGDQTVYGTKTIKEVHFLGNVFPQTVNGMKLQRDLVTLHTDQEIEGPIVFEGNVIVENHASVGGLINGINLTKLAEEAVYLNTSDTIEGFYNFRTVKVDTDVHVEGFVNNIDLPLFDRQVDGFWLDAAQSLEIMDRHSDDSCELTDYLQDVLSKSYYILDGLNLHQDFGYPASFLQIKSSEEINLVKLDDLATSATAIRQLWNSSTSGFITISEQITSIRKYIIKKVGNLEVSINIGIQDKDSFVSIGGEALSIPGGFKEASIWIEGPVAIIAILFPTKGICDFYRIITNNALQSPALENYGTINVGKEATSVAVFMIRNETYLAVSVLSDAHFSKGFSKIYKKEDEDWQRVQNIAASASNHVKHFFYHGFHYLVFTNNAPIHETREPKSIQVYRNSGYSEQWFTLFQKVPFDDTKGLETFEFGDLSELYLVAWNETRIQVFRLEGESGLRTSFTLHGKCIKDVQVLPIDADVYLAVGQQNLNGESVSSLLYKGITKGIKYEPRNLEHC
ncbi:hypothetical protein HNY73_008801 [Argiope bruennichi]|uniref:Uncharacterized protein n=1 Tax=Argiope bruennichi TaxID=94029 RepID=A0A8T0F7M9_ARGBR|nr:hypothetical protein HNY73_008801 [Argiope bruennichi]